MWRILLKFDGNRVQGGFHDCKASGIQKVRADTLYIFIVPKRVPFPIVGVAHIYCPKDPLSVETLNPNPQTLNP